ncbi:MAG: serine/threonine-protein phosphatase [Phycisphaerae bacterium]|nr:serine/threonine-protein phosphatase [Phycisphaerae bacterium]
MADGHAPTIADERPVDIYRLSAMEIWGGSGARRERVKVPGLEADIHCVPHEGAAEGGDLHFLSTCAMGQISRFTIADIAGHGHTAGPLSARLRALIRKHINTPNPTRFTQALNEEFAALSREGLFATALIVTYFAPTDHLIVCNAGHPRPLIRRASRGRWELLDERCDGLVTQDHAKDAGVGNLPLGLLEGTRYPQYATPLEPGDALIAYTDAFIEAADPAGMQLGEQGLLALVQDLDPARPDLRDEIIRRVDRHRGGAPANDDATLLVLRHTADNPPPLRLSMRLKTLGKLVGVVRLDTGKGF